MIPITSHALQAEQSLGRCPSRWQRSARWPETQWAIVRTSIEREPPEPYKPAFHDVGYTVCRTVDGSDRMSVETVTTESEARAILRAAEVPGY
jgi:hypothetical protein